MIYRNLLTAGPQKPVVITKKCPCIPFTAITILTSGKKGIHYSIQENWLLMLFFPKKGVLLDMLNILLDWKLPQYCLS